MGMKENWALFIQTTKTKSKSHLKAAQHWNTIGSILSLLLIFLGALTTFMALIKAIPITVVAGVAAISTLLSAVSAFMRPADRRQLQTAASREFQELTMKMVRCETELEYEELWKDLNKAIVDAPFLPKKFASDVDIDWTMTPELLDLIAQKEGPDKEKEDLNEEIGIENKGYGSINGNAGNLNSTGNFKNDETIELLTHK